MAVVSTVSDVESPRRRERARELGFKFKSKFNSNRNQVISLLGPDFNFLDYLVSVNTLFQKFADKFGEFRSADLKTRRAVVSRTFSTSHEHMCFVSLSLSRGDRARGSRRFAAVRELLGGRSREPTLRGLKARKQATTSTSSTPNPRRKGSLLPRARCRSRDTSRMFSEKFLTPATRAPRAELLRTHLATLPVRRNNPRVLGPHFCVNPRRRQGTPQITA